MATLVYVGQHLWDWAHYASPSRLMRGKACGWEQVHSVLELPKGVDELVSLSWSPLQLPNALLAVTRQGAGYLWMQPSTDESGAMISATIDQWAGQRAFQGCANPGGVPLTCVKGWQ